MPLNSVADLPATPHALSSSRGAVTVYDFRRPTQLSREHIRVLQMAFGSFARRLTTLLTSGLRQVCQVRVDDITHQSYEEYVTSLDTQTLMAPMSLPPLSGTCVLEFSLQIALAAVDYMLGGRGGTQSARTLTDIETTLLRGLLEQMAAVLRYSLEPIVEVTPSLGTIEYNPQFVQAAGATDAVVVATFDMVVGSESCRSTLCLPLASLLPRLMAQEPHTVSDEALLDAEQAERRLRERLGDLPLTVAVRFPPVSLSPQQILTLSEGDIVPLGLRVGSSLAVQTGGTTFASAIAGRAGNRLAALIVDPSQEHS